MKFIIETYGCQMNVADSELIVSILNNAGLTHTENIDDAQIIIFNTCSVRENAEKRVIGRITSEVSRKSHQNNLLVGIVGCMAQRLGEELKKINKKIDFVVGVDQYSLLPEIIEDCLNNNDFISKTTLNQAEIYNDLYPTRSNPLNAFITIMRGCNNFCTYCIVPFTRGRERSRPIKEILSEIELAGQNKSFEVTLLGQNVNSYSFENNDFPDLLQKANEIDSIRRIRFVTSHPKDLSDKLIETMATYEKVCEHIHLPLQSGNNEILNKMNRKYTAEHYLNLINKLRKAMPDIAITTDVIAGFPSETEEQYLDTLNIMKEIQFDFAYMFKYSERTGTKAADFEDSIPETTRLYRLQNLIDQQTEITTAKYKKKIGSIQEVYVECKSKRNSNEMSGKTRDFKITVFDGNESLINQFVKVKIVDAVGWTLKGIKN
ncbi:MAG: tRNA (N6-isopentenyl adenosine(37)-C2)-methylthiotransferase MiaB [Candidatus Cloacimonetes bacterium]|nr:tRNA (N6-isopentenyl adenosine(37)-C2)-methylthiotransferase MiaB [Candidatus Cloacimonadota bacterium]